MYFQVSEIMDPEAGHVHRDGVVLACEVLECCPWFEFADLDVYGNTTEEEADDLSTDPDELLELGMLAVTHTAHFHNDRSARKAPSLRMPIAQSAICAATGGCQACSLAVKGQYDISSGWSAVRLCC
jgi:hypothetical protein